MKEIKHGNLRISSKMSYRATCSLRVYFTNKKHEVIFQNYF